MFRTIRPREVRARSPDTELFTAQKKSSKRKDCREKSWLRADMGGNPLLEDDGK